MGDDTHEIKITEDKGRVVTKKEDYKYFKKNTKK